MRKVLTLLFLLLSGLLFGKGHLQPVYLRCAAAVELGRDHIQLSRRPPARLVRFPSDARQSLRFLGAKVGAAEHTGSWYWNFASVGENYSCQGAVLRCIKE